MGLIIIISLKSDTQNNSGKKVIVFYTCVYMYRYVCVGIKYGFSYFVISNYKY